MKFNANTTKRFLLYQKAELFGNHNLNKYKPLLGHDFYNEEIHYYYKKVIGKGDWHSMQEAIRIIQSKHFNSHCLDRWQNPINISNLLHLYKYSAGKKYLCANYISHLISVVNYAEKDTRSKIKQRSLFYIHL